MMSNISTISCDIRYNGDTGEKYGVSLYDYPEFSGGERKYDVFAATGRLGEVIGLDNYTSNLKISCTLSLLSQHFWSDIRKLKRWLTGTGELAFTDDLEVFYKVKKIDYGNIDRELKNYGRFTVIFTCIPYEFTVDGQNAVSKVPYNSYCESRPTYKIIGEGLCTLTVNGKTMTANVGQNLTIDTELMLAYRQDGKQQNTSVAGNYEDLYLKPGNNDISITNNFQLSIIPNWGYEV